MKTNIEVKPTKLHTVLLRLIKHLLDELVTVGVRGNLLHPIQTNTVTQGHCICTGQPASADHLLQRGQTALVNWCCYQEWKWNDTDFKYHSTDQPKPRREWEIEFTWAIKRMRECSFSDRGVELKRSFHLVNHSQVDQLSICNYTAD